MRPDPIERDESMDRTYIPMPGGYEVQTKGRGSSFRIAETKPPHDRALVIDERLHEILEDMARATHAQLTAQADEIERLLAENAELRKDAERYLNARPLEEWSHDIGDAVWFTLEDGDWLGEPSWIGTPHDSNWPGYHTHWVPHPPFPKLPETDAAMAKEST